MIVLDASAAIGLALGLPQANRIEQVADDHDWVILAPQLLQIEVLQVLRRWVKAGNISDREAQEALELLDSLGIRHFDHDFLRDRVWELKDNLTAHDAAYVALAESLSAPVLTTDKRLGNAPGNRARVIRLLISCERRVGVWPSTSSEGAMAC